MDLSRKELMTSLRDLWLERRRLLQRLTQERQLALGTVSTVHGKCGKPNCRCAQGAGHPQVQFLFYGQDGRRRCKLIRQEDAKRWLQAGKRYKEFKDGLKQLRTLNLKENEILIALMKLQGIYYE
jgi:Family of unknown function (DUF6788)